MSKCPYCNKELTKTPTRKSKCPHCGNQILLKRKPGDSEVKHLVTELEAQEIEKLWDKFHEEDREKVRKRKLVSCIEIVGLTEKFYEDYKKLPNNGITDHQIVGKILFEYLDHLKKNKQKFSYAGFSMAFFTLSLIEAESKQPFLNYLSESHRCKLLDYQQSKVVKKVKILTVKERYCDKCKSLENKIFTIDEALQTMPLPHRHCETNMFDNPYGNWCRCFYTGIVDEDA